MFRFVVFPLQSRQRDITLHSCCCQARAGQGGDQLSRLISIGLYYTQPAHYILHSARYTLHTNILVQCMYITTNCSQTTPTLHCNGTGWPAEAFGYNGYSPIYYCRQHQQITFASQPVHCTVVDVLRRSLFILTRSPIHIIWRPSSHTAKT